MTGQIKIDAEGMHYTPLNQKIRAAVKDGATEIISMGLEKMYKDPIAFLDKDPEYFEFIVKVMWGDL